MPRTVIAVAEVSRAGLTEPAEANGDLANGNECTNDGRVIVRVRNAGAGVETVTFVTPGTIDGLAVADLVISISAGGIRYVGPFPADVYGNPLAIIPQSANIKLIPLRTSS